MLGFVVWQGARWYARRRVAQMLPSRRVATAALVVSAVATVAWSTRDQARGSAGQSCAA